MAPWLPPIVMYCPPAQQCSAVAPPAPPRPHPRPRPVPPPCRCPPFSPPPPHPPRASPAIKFVGEKGGRSRGVRSGFPALGRAGGRFRRLRYGPAHVRHTWARLPAWLYKAVRAAGAALLASRGKDPSGAHQRDGMPPRSVRAELLIRPFATNGQQYSGTPGNGIPACASSTGVRAGAPRAAHSFAAFPALHRPAAAVA